MCRCMDGTAGDCVCSCGFCASVRGPAAPTRPISSKYSEKHHAMLLLCACCCHTGPGVASFLKIQKIMRLLRLARVVKLMRSMKVLLLCDATPYTCNISLCAPTSDAHMVVSDMPCVSMQYTPAKPAWHTTCSKWHGHLQAHSANMTTPQNLPPLCCRGCAACLALSLWRCPPFGMLAPCWH